MTSIELQMTKEQTPNELTLNDGEINNDGLLIDDTGIGVKIA